MKKERAKELLSFDGMHVAVIGDIMLDEYMFGNIERISPEAPVPVVLMQSKEHKLGGAANVAMNTKNLGVETSLIGIIGNDAQGEKIESICKEERLLTAFLIKDFQRKTTCKTRVLAKNQQIIRIDNEDIIESDSEIIKKTLNILKFTHQAKPIQIIIFQDYNKGFFSPKMIDALMNWASTNKIITCLDPKFNNIQLFKGLHLFKPNLREIETFLNQKIQLNKKDLELVAKSIFEKLDCNFLVLTLSSNGIYISDSQKSHHESIKSKSIVDVSGAGDTVIALVSLLLFKGEASLEEIAQLANYAGAVVCNIPGVAIIDIEAILKHAE